MLIFTGTAYYALTKRRLFIEHRKGEPGIVVRPERPYITVFGPVYPMTIHHARVMRRWKVLHVILAAVFLLLLGIHLATTGN
ncbi:hypothetical protein [Thermococcus zilligii]|uniref:hypothetical protein n=1 Tax=Thermococcus zilligii TaxID=54076 RepID=UPI00029A560F|nr:hypothetical protein [Thermococcus zilligii]